MNPIGSLLDLILDIVLLIVIVDVVLSWLVAFNVVNRANEGVRKVQDFTRSVTEPLLRPIRQVVPPLGGLDVTPIILLFAIRLVQIWVIYPLFS
ncbi:MAG: YggT family protein [Alphaproteobacteria bacterium]|nr:MAG: YggT family protein [Alphaproteobacteria bacterium]